jgi:hypothetical protein
MANTTIIKSDVIDRVTTEPTKEPIKPIDTFEGLLEEEDEEVKDAKEE